jgi:hypothetical protein
MDIEITRQSAMLETMTIEELRQLNEEVIATINHKRKMASMAMKSRLLPGMLVEADHSRLVGQTFEVVQVKRTKANIRNVEGGPIYSIPMSMLSEVVTS